MCILDGLERHTMQGCLPILHHNYANGRLFPNWTRQIGGTHIPLVILGDPAYYLLPTYKVQTQLQQNIPSTTIKAERE